MKIVLFEYATSGGADGPSAPALGLSAPGSSAPPLGLSALAREGELMLYALGRGLSAMDGVRLVTVRDARLPPPDYPTGLAWVRAGDDCAAVVGAALEDADAFWPVAPETGGLLAQFCRLARGGSCLLLNSPAPVVEKAGGKYSAFLRLRQNGVRCVETARLGDLRFPQDRDLVVKPDDGAGCESVYLLRAGESPPRGSLRGNHLCQPYLPGVAASLNVIYPSTGAPYIIGANRQEVTLDAPDAPNVPDAANAAKTPDAANAAHAANAPKEGGRFRLRACHVNALAREALGFEELAAGVQRSFPGIVGHVGIDLIVDGDNTLHLLEINPRVTTSFAGLAASTGLNPCAEVIRAVRGEACTPVSRRRFVPVEVRLDGAA